MTVETICGHHRAMKNAKVSELKASLSAYLDEVRRGGSVVVCDRKTPIARIVPFLEDAEGFQVKEPSGSVRELEDAPRVSVRPGIDPDRALAESRGGR